MNAAAEADIKATLKRVFGYDTFRGNQHSIIHHLMNGQNAFVVMPTGAGKSLCYQLPAIMNEGTAIVISPLIALMKNQVDQMNAVGIHARFMNSTLSRAELTQVKKDTMEGKTKLLYLAPESLTKAGNLEFLKKIKISFVAIDEAHCISEWGHDFRPEYRRIRTMLEELGEVPIIALTATATPKVQLDIIRSLRMEDTRLFQSSFNRENLYYEVRPKQEAKKHLIRFIKDRHGQSGIIYCLSRKKVEEIASFLQVNDLKAAPYHAGMDAKERMKNQDAFLNEEVDIIVATIAFGMGIDKPDVRFVVHYDAPKSIEGYYQETGRAGRDGIGSHCLMFYSYNDILKLEKFSKDKAVSERENARLLLDELAAYAESGVCRRKQLLHYFGEEWTLENCENCDNCVHPKPYFNGQKEVALAIQVVEMTNERFEINHLASVLAGKSTSHVESYSHNELEVFGAGKEHEENFWRSVIRQSLMYELLVKDLDNPGIYLLTQKGREFLKDPYPLRLFEDHVYEIKGDEEEFASTTIDAKAYDRTLFDMLKALRKKVAHNKGLPPYVIFQDPSLEEMATTYPMSADDLKKIVGIGESKARKFGAEFIKLIQRYVEENDITTMSDVLVKSSGAKSKNKIHIITQIDKKIDFEEIAEDRNLTYDKLIKEVEIICFGGTKLNIDYYINQLMDQDRQEDIRDYFMNADSDDLNEAVEELGDDFSEDEIRLYRIKFMSEHAH